ncbi:MAG: glycoside hydrolase family 127 protein [Bifidobacteriaceae bacterium]|jgi:DUF1680 family protein|nr:glycoside hydrolase family 127 protein [Bifidobacteriaceae bacterium]MCI1979451.1 glycoside hydrolase family 127 protein [Bifidobacteriaceae bacterium]
MKGGKIQGPIALDETSKAVLKPLDLNDVEFAENSLFKKWEDTVPNILDHCKEELVNYGNISNLERLAGESDQPFKGFPFADSDIYKTLEAASWSQNNQPRQEDREWMRSMEQLLGKVQESDGYLDSKIQGDASRQRWDDLLDSHEMYCIGHLIQAGVAAYRSTDDTELLDIAVKAADCVVERFGPNGTDGICGHPEIETALVELYRQTGQDKYLETAHKMIDLRGHGLLTPREYFGFGSRYYVDQVPVREADEAMGHAVRQLYLEAGVVDLYLETGDRSLLDASERVWNSAHGRKMFITGGMGSRHRDESFGDDFELSPDRSYSETCAAIADFQWSWRLLLATGDERYADAMERAIYNAIPVGASTDGLRYFYSNPLQVRTGHPEGTDFDSFVHRAPWFDCPCCPPNVARLYASLPAYMATLDSDNYLDLHLFSAGRISVPRRGGGCTPVEITTEYPWDGRINVHVPADADLRGLRLRVPAWCSTPQILSGDGQCQRNGRFVEMTLSEGTESTLSVNLPMSAALMAADSRIDAVRGCRAVCRGPVVYAIEQKDIPNDLPVERLRLSENQEFTECHHADIAGVEATTLQTELTVEGTQQSADPDASAYFVPANSSEGGDAQRASPVATQLIPYFLWGNRASDSAAMRVWIPEHQNVN